MERGIYFDAWMKNNHCYHPSLPLRNIKMIDELEKYRATSLVWSAMGGGSISLPYLEQEAFATIDPRLRFYGYMNDSEFIAECNKRGIKVFGIVFEVQGWEFPVILSDDGKSFKEFNVLSDPSASHDWYGLREFSNKQHEQVFPTKLKDYYPNGIINSDGEHVTDLWEEVAARKYDGSPVHARWVECPDNAHQAYQTCRNNPVWLEYMKKIMKIMVDAGIPGIQLDEAELPITSIGSGGCFCKDCRKQFTAYLKELRQNGKLSSEYDNISLDGFDYKEYINEKGITFPNDERGVPMFREYYEFQIRAVKKYFSELVAYSKQYARDTYGKELLVSGNFFNCMPVYYPIENTVDLIITEMQSTLFRQPYWYRYVNGFSGSKPVIVAENPYGGVIPELLQMLDKGKGYDLYRLLMLEASAYGCNMSVPYGGWMGSVIEDAFYPPQDVTIEIQNFLADNERLFSKASGSKVMVMYSFPSYYWLEATKSYTGNVARSDEESILFYNPTDIMDEKTTRVPFWEVIKELADNQIVYDVKMFGDDELRAEQVTSDTFEEYSIVIIPDCHTLTQNQASELKSYALHGGRVLVLGRAGENMPEWQESFLKLPSVVHCPNKASKKESMESLLRGFETLYKDAWQVKADDTQLGVHLQKTSACQSVHLLNYNYDEITDKVMPIEQVNVCVRIDGIKTARALTPSGEILCSCELANGILKVNIKNLPLYTVLELQ